MSWCFSSFRLNRAWIGAVVKFVIPSKAATLARGIPATIPIPVKDEAVAQGPRTAPKQPANMVVFRRPTTTFLYFPAVASRLSIVARSLFATSLTGCNRKNLRIVPYCGVQRRSAGRGFHVTVCHRLLLEQNLQFEPQRKAVEIKQTPVFILAATSHLADPLCWLTRHP